MQDFESSDDASTEIGKHYHKRVRDEDDESTDAEEWWNFWFWFSFKSWLSFSSQLRFICSANCGF